MKSEPDKIWNVEKSDSDLYWLAGLVQAKGSFGVQTGANRNLYPTFMLGMTDKDIIDRAASLVGYPTVKVRPDATQLSRKVGYEITLSGREAMRMMQLLEPLMSERRKEQIRNCLTLCEAREGLSSFLDVKDD